MDALVSWGRFMSHSIVINSVSLAAADRLAALALDHAREKGWKVAVVVSDVAGAPVVLRRMDGVSPITGEIALDKAYTAAVLRRTTRALAERMTSAPDLTMGMANRPRLIAWQGGLPIIENGTVIGGLGVSGAAGH
jgi:glc operon protein GlcG